ncbi:VUT family protein [Devosia sp. XJ19-1]|uniref:VUT family protein n=1 Tax=Devosia ureilytica TaxID=2952754 RepID=A0A9Q4AMB4_9HYPH|nr:VUT family protein [Devosia ureilytica]MCP8883399.1 VUT family protein [Devosia ureilytica]MCP8886233.1 VUT family protein [Devosia ureilytica]
MSNTPDLRWKVEGIALIAAFTLTVPLANWMIGNVGTVCVPDGPCLVPVAPGLLAPSGVLVAGLAFVLRDFVQQRLGAIWAIAAIVAGAAISATIAPPALVIASAAAFLVSELADMAVFTPLRRRGLLLAVFASSIVGLFVDTLIFLQLAFGSTDLMWGQVVGKSWMVVLALPLVHLLQTRRTSTAPIEGAQA